jgi:hypothetical protein
VDAFHQQLAWDDRGTNFAFWRRSVGAIPGIWFRLDFIVEADVPVLDEGGMSQHAVQRMADAAFPPIIQKLWQVIRSRRPFFSRVEIFLIYKIAEWESLEPGIPHVRVRAWHFDWELNCVPKMLRWFRD